MHSSFLNAKYMEKAQGTRHKPRFKVQDSSKAQGTRDKAQAKVQDTSLKKRHKVQASRLLQIEDRGSWIFLDSCTLSLFLP
jgi:hypothetical protein